MAPHRLKPCPEEDERPSPPWKLDREAEKRRKQREERARRKRIEKRKRRKKEREP